ncbi:MAG: hypothetical protein ACREKM_07480 [Longimicrobiales bacterium]
MKKALLTVTDLTERSDAAVVWADTIARARGWDLHVAHAVSLAERERGTSTGQLLQLERAIVTADVASRAQMQRTLRRPTAALPRIIDLDGLVPAMLRRAAVLQPELIIIASGWSWDSTDTRADALSPAVIRRLASNLLIVRDALPPLARRIIVALDPDSLDAQIIRAAARWSHWLREATAGAAHAVPDLDVVFVNDDDGPGRDLTAVIEREPADLIVAPAAMTAAGRTGRQRDAVMEYLLAHASAPVLLLRDQHSTSWPTQLYDTDMGASHQKTVSLIA